MRIPWRLVLRILLIGVIAGLVWVRYSSTRSRKSQPAAPAITDLAATSPLNQPGGGPAPAESYQVYSALYQAPANEPLAFAENSATDIPQVGGSCLKPSTPEQQEMADAFAANNRLSHKWEQKFSIPAGYRLLSHTAVPQALACLQTHGHEAEKCAAYAGLKHVRLLGVPGFDKAQDKALVSVIKNCGGVCGSGGIFAVEKKGDSWQRADTTDFTRDCSWMY